MREYDIVLHVRLTEDLCEDLDNLLDDNSIVPDRYEVTEVK